MAIDAFNGAVLVDHDLLFPDHFGLHVTLRAGDTRMPARQRQMRLVMVKRRGNPPLRVVAVGAVGLAVLCQELPVVGVLVAGFTLHRRAFESLVGIGCSLVALSARNGAMRAEERELGLGVVEAIDIGPRLHRVTGFAAERRSIRPLLCHAVVKFALVRILMAGGARLIFEFERQYLVRAPGCA